MWNLQLNVDKLFHAFYAFSPKITKTKAAFNMDFKYVNIEFGVVGNLQLSLLTFYIPIELFPVYCKLKKYNLLEGMPLILSSIGLAFLGYTFVIYMSTVECRNKGWGSMSAYGSLNRTPFRSPTLFGYRQSMPNVRHFNGQQTRQTNRKKILNRSDSGESRVSNPNQVKTPNGSEDLGTFRSNGPFSDLDSSDVSSPPSKVVSSLSDRRDRAPNSDSSLTPKKGENRHSLTTSSSSEEGFENLARNPSKSGFSVSGSETTTPTSFRIAHPYRSRTLRLGLNSPHMH